MIKIKKYSILLVVFLFLGIASSYAQSSKATIQFKDGAKVRGYAKLISKNRVKFRKSLGEKGVKYNFDQCEYVKIAYTDETKKYVQFPVQGKSKKIIVHELIVGAMSLYAVTSSGYAPTAGNFGAPGAAGPGLGTYYSSDNYYLKREGQDFLIHIQSNPLFYGRFREKGAAFFKDCPELALKIENREKGFRKKNIEGIVTFYNQKCQSL